MNITILVYVEEEGSSEYDAAIDQVADALTSKGHKPSICTVHGDLTKMINSVRRRKPELVFNLLEQFGEGNLGLVEITAVLELLGFPYTGGGSGELYLQEDKALTKKMLTHANVKCPDFAVFSPHAEQLETAGNLRMPLFVKPLRMDASQGIDAQRSLVHTTAELMERVVQIHKKFQDAALCEQYIEGREFYVGVLGNQEPRALPPIEMDFSKLADGMPHVMDAKAKFDESSAEYQGTKPVVAELDDQLRARLQQVALDSYRALRVRDYGRIDMRLTETGDIYVIEVNANCYLEKDGEFAMAAKADGIEYPDLIQMIADMALQRRDLRSADPKKRRYHKKPARVA